MPEVQRLWLSVRWVSMMPVACTGANMVVGPTQTKPRRCSSAASAGDSGEQVGYRRAIAVRVCGPAETTRPAGRVRHRRGVRGLLGHG